VTKADVGDERALYELRRMQRTGRPTQEPGPSISAHPKVEPNAIIYRGPIITHEVHRNGDVTYKANGRAVIEDEGRSLRIWESDPESIELALRMAQAKFGKVIELTGPDEFQQSAARVAAEAKIYVEFSDESLNLIMRNHRAGLDTKIEPSKGRVGGSPAAGATTAETKPIAQQDRDRPDQEPGIER